MKKLSRTFYNRDALTLAPDLLGKILVRNDNGAITSGLIVETEAYCGPLDKAAHTFNNKRTSRTEILFHSAGFAYIYMIYGLHHCLNVTANLPGKPECVLVRALQPLDGQNIMSERRHTKNLKNLCNGPGKLCQAMNITRELYGADLCGTELYILDNSISVNVRCSPRIGIDYAQEYRNKLWRFFIDGNAYVSQQKTPPT